VKALARALRHRCGVRPGQRLLLAVSGGCDSLALLRAMAILAPRRGWNLQLIVGHVQHHLREQAESDAAFVADAARRLNLPHLRRDIRVPAGVNVEAFARRARYEALLAMARETDAAAVITAHHADDQLETLLMRLLRGSSLRGLAGMAWRRRLADSPPVHLLRPMLAVERAAARDFLASLDQAWCEDHTNADVTRLRARLRREVMPVLRAVTPTSSQRAVRLGDHLRQSAAVLDAAVHAALGQHPGPISRQQARQWPAIVLTGVLRQRLEALGVPADRLTQRHLAPLARAARDRRGGVRPFDLSPRVRVTVDAGFIRIEPA
jgi:tRNA(Ile)-lysidine synthase